MTPRLVHALAGRSVRHAAVGNGSNDPPEPEPELRAVCGDCGRPVLWRLVRVLGVDVLTL